MSVWCINTRPIGFFFLRMILVARPRLDNQASESDFILSSVAVFFTLYSKKQKQISDTIISRMSTWNYSLLQRAPSVCVVLSKRIYFCLTRFVLYSMRKWNSCNVLSANVVFYVFISRAFLFFVCSRTFTITIDFFRRVVDSKTQSHNATSPLIDYFGYCCAASHSLSQTVSHKPLDVLWALYLD